MRFHVVSLPHTQTTKAYSACAYTQKVIGFCKMMMGKGHEVFLYSGTMNEAPCTKHICVMYYPPKLEGHYVNASFDKETDYWKFFNKVAINCIEETIQSKDFICLIAGTCHKPIADAFPEHMSVEFGVGYSGIFSKYKVFESYAWMHCNYGPNADGQWFDAVIPNYLDPIDFTFSEEKENYYVYLGRKIDRKGYKIAQEVCDKLGKKLIIKGPPDDTIGPEERSQLLSKAQALFCPTIYIEPFGTVTAEAMMCGTPVITTDWGAFTENNIPDVTGYRCRTFSEFCKATEDVLKLDKKTIRDYAMSKFSLDVVANQYEQYFNRLNTLWGKGWYSED